MREPGTTPDLQELADRAAISQILALHCRGVDRADEATLKSCYWPDATTAYGAQPVPAHEFCEGLVLALQAYAQTHHVVSNTLCEIAGSTAKVESTLVAFHYQAAPSGGDAADTEMTYLGRYLDRFEKRGNVWKLAHREPIMGWSQHSAASHDGANPALAQLRTSGRFPDDPIYDG